MAQGGKRILYGKTASPVGDILPVVSDIPLDVDDDRFDVKSALIPVAAKWKDIGTALRLKAGDLDAIEAAHPGDPRACLSEGVTHWLRRNYNSKRFGPPTWRKLVEVVADPAAGGNPALAREIALKHCVQPDDSTTPKYIQVTPIPLRRQKWYHRITRIAAERKLQDTPDGCFLVRESESREGSYALSLNHQRMVKHFCIRRKASGQYELDGMEKSFDNLPALVDYYSRWSISTEGELLRVPFAANSLPDGIIQQVTAMSITSKINPQSRLKWRRRADLPVPMTYPQVVRINDDIYVGGGCTKYEARSIYKYNLGNTWSTLPICPTYHFGFAELDGRLVLAGGQEFKSTPTDAVYVLEESKEWKSLPRLPTARSHPTVFSYDSSLIVCGGIISSTDGKMSTHTAAVEIFRKKTSQWHKAEPLPFEVGAIPFTIINDTCYLLGGVTNGGFISRRAICASLSSLLSSTASPLSSTWKDLPNCPLYVSTAAELGGCLLAIGGADTAITPSPSVHLYLPSTKTWVRMTSADLPESLCRAAATQLASGETILVGGEDSGSGSRKLMKTVFTASLIEE